MPILSLPIVGTRRCCLRFIRQHQSKRSLSGSVDVFDRKLKQRQREWSLQVDDSTYYDYLRKESAARLVDRIEDINKSFPMALELGCHRGQIFELLNEKTGLNGSGGIGGIESLIECDNTEFAVQNSILRASERLSDGRLHNIQRTHSLICDEEFLPFKEKQFDIVLSNMNLHWVNDLPTALKRIKDCLKPDGVFLCSMLGGSTLEELRRCFYLAEQERKGGMSPHTSPFARASDLAALMQAAEFELPTIDVDNVKITYPDVFTLMEHLAFMGEGTASINRHYGVGTDTFLSMASIYQELYGREDGSIPATFQLIYGIGWSPDKSQPKACKRGSASKSLKDLGQGVGDTVITRTQQTGPAKTPTPLP